MCDRLFASTVNISFFRNLYLRVTVNLPRRERTRSASGADQNTTETDTFYSDSRSPTLSLTLLLVTSP